jgi:hypothetical protein
MELSSEEDMRLLFSTSIVNEEWKDCRVAWIVFLRGV